MQSKLGRYGFVHVRIFHLHSQGPLLRPHIITLTQYEVRGNDFSTWFRPSTPLQSSTILDQDKANLLLALKAPFAGSVSIRNRELALEAAHQDSHNPNAKRLVFWTDGSVSSAKIRYEAPPEAAGISIVWRSNDLKLFSTQSWSNKTYKLYGYFKSEEAEFLAISEALKIAQSHLKNKDNDSYMPKYKFWHFGSLLSPLIRLFTSQKRQPPSQSIKEIHIYTDSMISLKYIDSFHKKTSGQRSRFHYQRELAYLKLLAREIHEQGISLTLSWVPGHRNVEGNEVANTLAIRAHKSRSLLNPPEVLSVSQDPFFQPELAAEIAMEGERKFVRRGKNKKEQNKQEEDKLQVAARSLEG